ncbi:MAG: alkene reductase [Burkholderiales bacterium PBB6]|uniref:Alkene reductase n=1 Tax=Ideonella margarita TaxID=2984191 RepID=A0ABU9CCA3_9BURK|nr:MAG: alkene reductase [Burkholderiales bacterium PBB6]
MSTLFSPLQVGDIAVANRIVMAPLTRNRAGAGRVPTDLMVEYYRQRANPATGAGLIITEASQISPMAQGYLDTPGIYSAEQVAGWKKVTDAVHAEGGKIVIQLWHVGRISHSSLLPDGAAPVSSSAKPANSKTFITGGFAEVSAPRALATEEIAGIVNDYRVAARNAIEAGFDGVEIHAANGYLIEQFLRDSVNDRTDAYGGSIANRARFLLEVAEAVTAEIGGGRTGIRLSPITPANDCGQDSNAQALFDHVARGLQPLKLAYCHVVEGSTGGPRDLSDQGVAPFNYAEMKSAFGGVWMVNNGYNRLMADEVLASGAADLVAWGRPFIANPDLGRRLREGAEQAKVNFATCYGGGAEGYTDYPALA